MISIHYLKSKFIIFLSSFTIGVIIILFSLIQINKAYANVNVSAEHTASSMVPFYWMIMLIGGIILTTLSYVSWRKYKGHKKSDKKRGTNN